MGFFLVPQNGCANGFEGTLLGPSEADEGGGSGEPRRGRVARKYRRYCLTLPIVKFLGIIVLILTGSMSVSIIIRLIKLLPLLERG